MQKLEWKTKLSLSPLRVFAFSDFRGENTTEKRRKYDTQNLSIFISSALFLLFPIVAFFSNCCVFAFSHCCIFLFLYILLSFIEKGYDRDHYSLPLLFWHMCNLIVISMRLWIWENVTMQKWNYAKIYEKAKRRQCYFCHVVS
jgi:hypothetical protein